MDGHKKTLKDFFDGNEKRFIIPVYQRNYDWKKANCEKLFEDLESIHNEEKESHFLGSIVSDQKKKNSSDLMIIDGQQRITTISILLIAMLNSINNGVIEVNDKERVTGIINETFLYAKYGRDARKLKLVPIKKDLDAYDLLITNDDKRFITSSNVTKNYYTFYNLLSKTSLSADEIFSSIEKLEIINIVVEEYDDPQLIFESLNSTGVKLTAADKIRNFLLMSLSIPDQEIYYQNFWSEIEKLIGNIRIEFEEENNDKSLFKDPTMFIRDYLTIQNGKISNIDDVYEDFKNYAKPFAQSSNYKKELFNSLLMYARYYENFITAKIPNWNKVNKKLKQLNVLKSAVYMPFFMSFLNYANEKNYNEDEVYEVICVIENYLARRFMCSLAANALNKIFAVLHNDVAKNISETVNSGFPEPQYSDVLKFLLLQKRDNTRMPKDIEVKEAFKTKRIYKMQPEQRFFFFERMENGNGKQSSANIVEQMKQEVEPLTIEHVMPQTLTAEWQKMLGPDYESIHDQYLHTFSNLTLTGYNSDYSNKNFSDKLNGYIDDKGNKVEGFKNSKLFLTESIKNCSKWNKDEMDNRCRILTDRFLAIWPLVTTNFEPINKEDSLTLEEDDSEFTGKIIQSYIYKGRKFALSENSWKSVEMDICKLVYDEYKLEVQELCKSGPCFSNADKKDYNQFIDGYYVYSDCSTSSKIHVLKKLFEACNIGFDEVEFKVKNSKENDSAKSTVL